MALHGAAMLLNQGGYSGYQIDQSMVLDGSSDYLSMTPSSTGDRKKWTTSFWVRRHKLGEVTYLFTCAAVSGNDGIAALYFNASDELITYYDTSGSNPVGPVTTRKYRDVGSWYHIIWAVDAVNTVHRIWVNGVELTANASYYPPNFNYGMNYANHAMTAGTQAWGPLQYADISIAELYHLDGQYITDPTTFGEFYNGTTAWRPIQPSGLTYGTNGFYLPFTQDTPNLGVDYSGNGNDWTENGSPVQSSDSPTVNLATMNPLDVSSDLPPTCADGNRTVSRTTGFGAIRATIAIDPTDADGYYWEVECNTTGTGYIGIANTKEYLKYSPAAQRGYDLEQSAMMRTVNGNLHWNNADQGSYGNSTANSDRLMFCVKNGKFYIGENGTWFNSGDPDAETGEGRSGLTELVSPCVSIYDGENYTFYFDSENWNHTAPTGAKEILAANLPEVTITGPGEYFNAVAYTGDGTAIGSGGNSITGVGFQSDFTWIKNRDATDSHMLFDVIRGATKVLHSNETAAETTESETLTSFDSDGFTLGSDVEVNTNTEDYISWNWKAGGAGVPNTDGTISSTVSVNDDAGFSIVSYTGTGSAGTVGHGQSAAPEMIICKNRTDAVAWCVYHNGVAADPETDYLVLNGTGAAADDSTLWNDIAPTSSVFSVGSSNNVNGSTDDIIAYCFRSIPGYSKVFSYTGNGSSDGPFVYLGFKPAWLLVKRSNTTGHWFIYDNLRLGYNTDNYYLLPDLSNAEGSGDNFLDLLSNGFKPRVASQSINVSGSTYIGIAFAENPFGGSNLPLGLAQ